ncbi:MAG: Ig-like domain-containing protein [Blastocatellia bacterium]|nr:Ig-like domain-containing protein [Blastocatellia bacterium]
METIFLSAGIACLIAAIVGGGLKAFGIEIPLLQSLTRQIILGALGVILVIASFATSSPPTPPDTKTSPTPSPTRVVSPGPTRVVPPRVGGPLHLSVNNNPRVVVAGGQTTILVRVTDRTGAVVAGVMVRFSAGGGSFAATGVTNADGLTDAQGLFRTNWHTYEARAYTGNMSYEMKIEATKEGYEKGETSFTVPVSLQ